MGNQRGWICGGTCRLTVWLGWTIPQGSKGFVTWSCSSYYIPCMLDVALAFLNHVIILQPTYRFAKHCLETTKHLQSVMLESSLSKTFPFWPHLTSSPHSRGPRIKFTNANFHLGTYKPFASYWQETTYNFSPDASRPHLSLGKRWPNAPGWCPTWRLEWVLIKQETGKWWECGMHCNKNNNNNNLIILDPPNPRKI